MAVRTIITILALLIPAYATAQQVTQGELNDPAFLQRTITALSTQRNQAYDAAAVAEARSNTLTADLVNARARIEELEKGKPSGKE